eukprot:Opistho-2@35891
MVRARERHFHRRECGLDDCDGAQDEAKELQNHRNDIDKAIRQVGLRCRIAESRENAPKKVPKTDGLVVGDVIRLAVDLGALLETLSGNNMRMSHVTDVREVDKVLAISDHELSLPGTCRFHKRWNQMRISRPKDAVRSHSNCHEFTVITCFEHKLFLKNLCLCVCIDWAGGIWKGLVSIFDIHALKHHASAACKNESVDIAFLAPIHQVLRAIDIDLVKERPVVAEGGRRGTVDDKVDTLKRRHHIVLVEEIANKELDICILERLAHVKHIDGIVPFEQKFNNVTAQEPATTDDENLLLRLGRHFSTVQRYQPCLL